MSEEFKLPTETIELPSKGLLYPEDSELTKGEIEIKYMTAKEEDILTNQSYIKKGVVLDKLMQSLIITKINYNDLLIGDKNAIMVAARVLGYGKDYKFDYLGEEQIVDLSLIENKQYASHILGNTYLSYQKLETLVKNTLIRSLGLDIWEIGLFSKVLIPILVDRI